MNRTLTPLFFAIGTSSLLLMDSAIKGSVILLGAACLAVMLRRDSAAMRHMVWLVAIVAMLFIPVLSVLLPRWQVLPAWAAISQSSPAIETPNRAVELPRPFEAPTAKSPEIIVPGDSSSQPEAIETSHNSETHEQPRVQASQDNVEIDRATSYPSWSWMTVLPFLWSIGFGVLILRLMAARWMLWSNEQRAAVIAVWGCQNDARNPRPHESDAAIAAAFESAHRQLGIRQRVRLLIDSDHAIPVVWGIVWFRLMLPDSARQWSSEQLRSVLLHELAHIKRRDTIVQLLTQFACALHWFNPLVWFAAWRLHVERERACDDLVLAQGVRASAYAEHLLNVATKLTVARWTSACGLAMASHSPLESRLRAILSDRLNRRKVSTAIGMIGLLLGAGIAIPIAMLRAAADDWNPPSEAHVGSNEFSAYCVHDGKNAAFVIAYQGFTGSSTAHDSNSKTRTWTDSGTITAKKPNIALSFHRTHTAPEKLSITTAPSEARDLSKPAPPPRKFGQKEYDLAKGRVFLLSDDGSVCQLDIATPMVRDKEAAMKLAALIAAMPPQEGNDVAFMTNSTVQLSQETVAKLKWGEPVNGLRMALAYPPALGDALLGKKPHFELVVQNVTENEIHFLASDVAPNPRNLHIREGDRIVLGLSDPTTSAADWKLRPGQCGVIRMYTKEESNKDGTIPSSSIESDLSKLGRYHAVVQMEIAKAPAGAWTGKLITGLTRGSADVAAAPTPMHKDAQSLYEVWKRYTRSNGDIPGALIGELAASVNQFIKYNPNWETVPKLNAILPRLDASRDWKPADAIALLDEVAGVQPTLLEPAPWKGTRNTIRHGDALPKKYVDVTWGEEQPNGLRAAWVLEPIAAEHRIGAALKARLLVQNRGQSPIMLQVPTWHQGWVKASDANGKDVEASGPEWTTMALLNTVRLGPGEYIEINTPGVGIGPRAGMGPWAGPRVGSNVLAKAGDELTLTHGLVPLDGSEVGVSEDDPHVSGPLWWLAHIKARLNRELPLPADAAERTQLLDRAVRELFATAPTAEETLAFIADKSREAIDALAKRLAARTDVVSFSGKLPTAPVKFRVLDSAADADKQPRVVLGPGEYPLNAGTAKSGAAKLKIVGKPVGERRTNDAQILFEATEATGKLPPDPHKLEVPDGWGTWAIVCRPNEGFFYLLSKRTVRKIDYTDPAKVTDNPANDLPAEFRDEVKRQLDIHGISDAQQAEIFEKQAVPAANANANIVTVPDDQYMKSGVPVDELAGEGVMWNDVQNGLSLGYRIMGDEWRILGKDVKVELWVQNHGDKEVKFQDNMRADPEFGLRVKLKDAKGEVHDSNFWPDDRPPFGFHRLLPPGHALKMKEFTISLFLPENDFSHAKGHFFGINPGAYNFHCELELPGFSATGEGGKQLTPAAGEWTGKLTTRGLNVEVIAPDAPAPKPRIESVVIGISKEGEISLNRKKMPLNELKTRSAKNAKKWFTIQADEDVPYAKVIEVVDTLQAAGVTQFSFSKARVGDGKYRVANRTGSYEFDETRRFSICQPFERKQWFTVAWPAQDGQPAKSLRLFPNASEQTRGTWAVVWEPGTDVLWWVDDTDIGKMTLTDPARVIVERKGRTTSFSRDFAVPDGVATEFRRLGFEVGGKPGEPLVIGGPTSKQEILSAEPVQKQPTDSTATKSSASKP